jgi:hypothetical protein
MKMQFLSGGRLRVRKATYYPDADRSEMIEIPVISALLRHRQGNVLFDTGCHPSVVDDPQARWGELAKTVVPIMRKSDNVLTSLKAIGVEPEDIDVVIRRCIPRPRAPLSAPEKPAGDSLARGRWWGSGIRVHRVVLWRPGVPPGSSARGEVQSRTGETMRSPAPSQGGPRGATRARRQCPEPARMR